MRAGGSKAKLGYHDQYVVDGGRARITLATLVTSASVMENSPMLDLVRWLRFRGHLRPQQATGDKAYATLENIKGLEDDGIKAYLPLPNWSRRPGFYGQEQFTYLPERDVYVCPQGQELTRRKSSQRSGAHFYRAAAGVFQACPVLSACTSNSRGRTIRRPFDQEYIERVRPVYLTRVSTETHAARSTSTKEKKLTSPPSRRSFAKRSPSTVLASRNLRRKRSPKGFRP